MNVLYITRGQSPHDLRFTKALAQTEHRVSVLCLESQAQSAWPDGVNYLKEFEPIHGSYWEMFSPRARQMRSVIKAVKPDLIHAGPIQRVAFWAVVAKFHPLVSMSWGSDLMLDASRSLWSRMVTRYTLGYTDVLVGDCDCVGKKAQRYGFPLERYRKFPWGVDLSHFSPASDGVLRQKLGWQNKIVLLSNRSLEKLYGVDVIIKAFLIARSQNPDLRLLLYGKGSQEAKLRKSIESSGAMADVYFGGFASYDELPEIYRSADIYLSASHSDGSSVSLMEALACGTPALVSNIPGNMEWITEGEQGWLFKDGSAKELAEKILNAAARKEDLFLIKQNCRNLAERRADWNKNFPVLLEAYQLAVDIYHKGAQSA